MFSKFRTSFRRGGNRRNFRDKAIMWPLSWLERAYDDQCVIDYLCWEIAIYMDVYHIL